MPRRSILSAAERESLLAVPEQPDDLIRHYAFSDADLSIIGQHRGAANRLGFAVLLSYMRYPGIILGTRIQMCAARLQQADGVSTRNSTAEQQLGSKLIPNRLGFW